MKEGDFEKKDDEYCEIQDENFEDNNELENDNDDSEILPRFPRRTRLLSNSYSKELLEEWMEKKISQKAKCSYEEITNIKSKYSQKPRLQRVFEE
ncbi:hypothetical protein CEXT_790481 [Caerostris extrusa]|uniref:Uncharacterized protein n=1 Tax=Caerostris extrusa TaxID=172846 RepID=A0AAV4WD24_CAEEX|nr:hypothetical protein CEXT_790481 [Caerostris extrusa]